MSNFRVTTILRAQRTPTEVRGYIHLGLFRTWCPDCHYYHAYAAGDAIRLSACPRQPGLIELVPLGDAEGEIADCIEAGEPISTQVLVDTARSRAEVAA
jgi:hypothetical protein